MQELLNELGWNLLSLPAAAAILGFMAWCGLLGQRALDRGPTRDLDLSLPEAGVGVLAGPLSAVLLGLPALMVLLYRATQVEAGLRKVGLIPRWPRRDLAWALVAVPVAVVLATAATIVTVLFGQLIGKPMDPEAQTGHSTLETLLYESDPARILLIVLTAAILAPVIEEISFRGVMQTALLRLSGTESRWPALLTTATVFGLMHHGAVTSWHMLPALIVLGLVFGYVYERTGSLLCCTLVHAGFNAWNLGLVLLAR
ncbi:MAG: CPBP family intramembrane glutamic endopeptidase [Planctomycetota bacterium]